MGVGDYIRARSDQYYPPTPTDDRVFSSQQQKTYVVDKSIAGNGLPASRFMRPLPPQFQEAEIGSPQQNNQSLLPSQQQKSIFDTDAEDFDDSTITVVSVGDTDPRNPARGIFDQDVVSQDWDSSVQSESDHHPSDNHRNEARFQIATTLAHRRKSSIPLAVHENAGYANDYDNFQSFGGTRFNERHRSTATTATRSKRNSVDKANTSRIPRAKSRMSLQRSDSDPGARSRAASQRETTTTARTVQVPYRSGYSRTSNFPQSLATTPNNRFNFKSERPYERLIQQESPTRLGSVSRPQLGRRHHSTSPHKAEQTRLKHRLPPSGRARVASESTDDISLDIDDEPEDDDGDDREDDGESVSSINAQSLSDITQRKLSASTMSDDTDKHHQRFQSDYPDEVLQQMDFSELEKEPFDHSPSASTNHTMAYKKVAPPTPPPKRPAPTAGARPPLDTTTNASEKLGYVMNALTTPSERHDYISSMAINEWEEFGDELIDQMSEMLKLMKESRQSRRRTTALFEAEIRRRHDETQNQSVELDRKFAEMKQGGLGVLRALNPAD